MLKEGAPVYSEQLHDEVAAARGYAILKKGKFHETPPSKGCLVKTAR